MAFPLHTVGLGLALLTFSGCLPDRPGHEGARPKKPSAVIDDASAAKVAGGSSPDDGTSEVRVFQGLEVGTAVGKKLKRGEVHDFRIPLRAGQYVELRVDQMGVDLVVALLAPDRQPLIEADRPIGSSGPEFLALIIQETGAYSLRVRGVSHQQSGAYRVTLVARRSATSNDEQRVQADRLFTRGEAVRRRGTREGWGEAIEVYQEGLRAWRELGDEWAEAEVLGRIGWCHQLLEEFQEAREHYEVSRATFERLGSHLEEAIILNRLGRVYRVLGEITQAHESYKRARALFERLGNREESNRALHNVGLIQRRLGHVDEALKTFEQVLANWQQLDDSAGEAATLISLGRAHLFLGRPHEAKKLFEEALGLSLRLTDKNRAVARVNLGTARLEVGEAEESLADFEIARDLYERAGSRIGVATVRQATANAWGKLGQPERARTLYQQALESFQQIGVRQSQAAVLAQLGRLLDSLGEYPEAEKHLREATRLYQDMRMPGGEASTRYALASLERNRGELERALEHIQVALELIELLRTPLSSDDLRIPFLASRYDYYELHIQILMDLHAREPDAGFDARALSASDRSRARDLLDLLRGTEPSILSGINPQLVHRARDLVRRISFKPGGDDFKNSDLLLDELRRVLGEMEGSSSYRDLRGGPVSLDEVRQQILDENTALLVYALGEERSFVWLVTPGSLSSHSLPGKKAVEMLARKALEQLASGRNFLMEGRARRSLAKLGVMLLGPVAEELAQQRLVIVGDGALHAIPWGALGDPRVQNGDPLIVNHEVVTAPSMSVLLELERKSGNRRPAPRTIAVLADPVFNHEDERLAELKERPVGRRSAPRPNDARVRVGGFELEDLPRLRYSREEAEIIRSLVPPEQALIAVDFEANREIVLDGTLKYYRVLHFATHGLFDPQWPTRSGMVFSLVDRQGESQEGLVSVSDFYRLQLPAELVVLSGCETALGKEFLGEGLVGLSRSLMYAGVSRLVVSLWRVRDQATAELMAHFYTQYFQEGLSAAAALREAQLSMLKNSYYDSPHNWAGFVLQGIGR